MTYRSFAAAAALLVLLPKVAGAGVSGGAVLAEAYARNDTLQSYTFNVDVAMTMRHFPWLHFHMRGTGQYDRGSRYVVHFTQMPWFAPQQRDIDLSMLDPQMWPQNYTAEVAGQRGGATLFSLHALKDASLQQAQVAIDPTAGTQWACLTYTDGTQIEMTVVSEATGGFLLPLRVAAKIDHPGMPLTADASFSDYTIGGP